MTNGKGSRPRPYKPAVWDENYLAIFRNSAPKKADPYANLPKYLADNEARHGFPAERMAPRKRRSSK